MKEIKKYHKIEKIMNTLAGFCTFGIVVAVFYIIGITGSLEQDAMTISGTIIRMAGAVNVILLLAAIRGAFHHIENQFARESTRLCNAMRIY